MGTRGKPAAARRRRDHEGHGGDLHTELWEENPESDGSGDQDRIGHEAVSFLPGRGGNVSRDDLLDE